MYPSYATSNMTSLLNVTLFLSPPMFFPNVIMVAVKTALLANLLQES